jgi:hypothetical protein
LLETITPRVSQREEEGQEEEQEWGQSKSSEAEILILSSFRHS